MTENVSSNEKIISAKEGLKKFGLKPIVLEAKEGLR